MLISYIYLQVLYRGLQHLQPEWLVFPWCPSCREMTVPGFLHQLDTIFPLHYYYGSAPGLFMVCCTGPQWVGLPLVSVKHCLIFSLAYVGLLGHSYPQYWANSSPIVCAVLAVDSWNYCSGEQAHKPNIFHSMFALHGLIDKEVESPVPPCSRRV